MKKTDYDPLEQVPRPDAVRIAVQQTETRLRKLRALLAASEAVESAGLRDVESDSASQVSESSDTSTNSEAETC